MSEVDPMVRAIYYLFLLDVYGLDPYSFRSRWAPKDQAVGKFLRDYRPSGGDWNQTEAAKRLARHLTWRRS